MASTLKEAPSTVSRRTVVKGAAWAAPAVAAVSLAPAASASPETPVISGTICQLGAGSGTINDQTFDIYYGVTSSTGKIPAGTVVTWTICPDQTTPPPNASYVDNGSYSFTATTQGKCIVVKQTFKREVDVATGNVSCPRNMRTVWTAGSSPIRPETRLDITSTAVGQDIEGNNGKLSLTVPRRHHSSSRPRRGLVFHSHSGSQTEYPAVNYTRFNSGPKRTNCAERNGDNTSTIYPDGTCVKAGTSGNASNLVPPRA